MADNKLKGIILRIVSALAFAIMAAAVKACGELPVYEKVFARNFVSLLIAFIAIMRLPKRPPLFGRLKNQPLLLSRSLLGLSGVALYFFAIDRMLLTDATILSMLNPAFIAIFASLFLHEKLSRLHLPALAIIFGCAILVIKPSFDLRVVPALAATGTAACAGGAYTILRALKGREEPATVVFYFSFVSCIVMLLPMFMHFKLPSPIQLFWLLIVGLGAAAGQFCLTYAHHYAKASEVSIYSYATVVFTLMLDILVWQTLPDRLSIIGGSGIILTAILLYRFERELSIQTAEQRLTQ